MGLSPCRSVSQHSTFPRTYYTHTHSSKLLSHHILSTKKVQNSQVAQISVLLRHFIPTSHVPFRTCYHRQQPFPISLTPHRSMPEARGNLQILWPRGSSHIPSGLLRHRAEPRSEREIVFFPSPKSRSHFLVQLVKSHLPHCLCLRP